MSAPLEYCTLCDEPTGRAGRYEDSLYIEDEGPFCELCYHEACDLLDAALLKALIEQEPAQ